MMNLIKELVIKIDIIKSIRFIMELLKDGDFITFMCAVLSVCFVATQIEYEHNFLYFIMTIALVVVVNAVYRGLMKNRSFIFALSLAIAIASRVLPLNEIDCAWIVLVSLVILLTTIFLYIMDAFKLAWRFYRSKQREKARQERSKEDKNRVTVSLLK
jgi:chromate transport protein ChrA